MYIFHFIFFIVINNNKLNKFKEHLSSQNLEVGNIHKIEYIYAMERNAYNIFKYIIENGYHLKYFSDRTEPVITFAAHSADLNFMKLLLKNKDKLYLNTINKKFEANTLEIAIWREREEIVEALINTGMTFSIKNYNNTHIGRLSIPFENIPINIKTVLLKKFVFNKTIKHINMVNEISVNDELNSFKNRKIYWNEYLDFFLNI